MTLFECLISNVVRVDGCTPEHIIAATRHSPTLFEGHQRFPETLGGDAALTCLMLFMNSWRQQEERAHGCLLPRQS